MQWKGFTAESDTWEGKENLENAKEAIEEYEREYRRDMENIRRQEKKEKTFQRGELPGRFTVRKLFGWMDKRYDKEYWARLERNWKRWKGERKRGQRMIETIKKEEEEIEQKNLGINKWTEEDDNEIGNMVDPYNEL